MRTPPIVLAVALALASPTLAQTPISNGIVDLSYAVDPVMGLVLQRLNETAPGTRSVVFNPTELWSIELLDPILNTKATLTPAMAASPPVVYTFPAGTPQGLGAVWNNFPIPGGGTCQVIVTAQAMPGERVAELKIQVDTTGSTRTVYDVEFPRLEVQPIGTEATEERLAVPLIGGYVIHEPRSDPYVAGHTLGTDWVQPGYLSMQWFSYYNEATPQGTNFFFGTRDSSGWRKRYHFDPRATIGATPGSLGTSLKVTPADHRQNQVYVMDFGYVIGVLSGDWFDGARTYKGWAEQQPWAAKGPMLTNADFSPAIRDAEMFGGFEVAHCASAPTPPDGCAKVRDRGNFQYWQRDLAEQKAYFGVTYLPSHVKFWDYNSFDANRGEWFPANPTFLSQGAQLTDAFSPYFISYSYSHDAPNYPTIPAQPPFQASTATLLLEDGHYSRATRTTRDINLPCDFSWTCPVTHVEDNLCQAASQTASYTQEVYRQLGALGGGAYLDLFSHTQPELCYSSQHGHGVADTASYATGMRSLLGNLRQTMKSLAGAKAFLHSESQQEFFLGELDVVYENIGLANSAAGNFAGAQIYHAPLFETVYHEYQRCATHLNVHEPAGGKTVTNPAALEGARQYFALRTAFGALPFAGSTLSPTTMAQNIHAYGDYGLFTEFMQRTMNLLTRNDVKPFTVHGERMRDPVLVGVQTRVAPLGALGYNLLDLPQPYVYSAAFTRPDLNEAAVLLLNWTDASDVAGGGSQNVGVVLDANALGLTPGTYTVTRTDPQGIASVLGTFSLTPTATLPGVIVGGRTAAVLQIF